MQVRTRDRLKALEAEILPKGRAFVFFKDETSALGSDEQVEAFKAEKGVGPHDTLVAVVVTYDASTLSPQPSP
jgi:hypothetical protein